MSPATLFAYMWVFAVLPSPTSAIVVVKTVTIFLGAPLWSSTDWKGQCFYILTEIVKLIFRPKDIASEYSSLLVPR
jgi:hypothetical protein